MERIQVGLDDAQQFSMLARLACTDNVRHIKVASTVSTIAVNARPLQPLDARTVVEAGWSVHDQSRERSPTTGSFTCPE